MIRTAPPLLLARLLLAPLLLVPAACSYDPPPQVDRASPTYRADLSACEDAAPGEVNKRNAKTGLAWFSSPVRRWGQIGDRVSACMAGKGYGQLRTCTDDELKAGGRSGTVVATAAGLRCADAPDAAHRVR